MASTCDKQSLAGQVSVQSHCWGASLLAWLCRVCGCMCHMQDSVANDYVYGDHGRAWPACTILVT
jgi:hypothetical protein